MGSHRRCLTVIGALAVLFCLVCSGSAGATGWSLQRATTVTEPGGTVAALSCPTRNFCLAVGSTLNAIGGQADLTTRWNGRSWAVERPLKHPQNFSSISCWSPRGCIAVGTAVARWNGSSWRIQQRNDAMSAVSCWSAHGCMAVGDQYANSDGTPRPVAQSWSGRSWRRLVGAG